MTRFDERLDDERTRPWAVAFRLIGADPAVFGIATAAVVVVLAMAVAAVLSAGELASRWSALTGSARLGVFLDPQLDRTEAERLKPVIEALPQVAGAVLRSRETALDSLAKTGLPAVQTRANPLPDVWVVALAPAPPGDVDSQQTRVGRLKATLATLPGAQSVEVDLQWAAWIDRWSPAARAAIRVAVAGASMLAVLGCFAVFFLAARAARLAGESNRSALALAALACTAVATVALALLVGIATTASGLPQTLWNFGQPLVDVDVGSALGIVAAGALAGCVTGAIAQKRNSRSLSVR